MQTKMIRQTMFTTGEVDEITWKRTDVPEYLTAAQSLLNMEVGTTGLAKKRKGSIAQRNITAYNPTPYARMFEFVDNNNNYYIVMALAYQFVIFSSPSEGSMVSIGTGASVVTESGAYIVTGDVSVDAVQIVSNPYSALDVAELDYAEDDDSIVFTHPSYPVARLYISSYSPLTFSYEALDIYPLPAYDFGVIDYNNYDVFLGVDVGDPTILVFELLGVSPNPGFNNSYLGGQIVGGGASDTQPIGYAIINYVEYNSLLTKVIFHAKIYEPFETTNYATKGSQYSIKQPAWVQTSGNPWGFGYPAKVLFYQNRLWLANTYLLSNTIFGSKINAPINMDVGTGRDTDAIVYKIGQTNAGQILWMNGGKQLEVFCQNNEFSCPQDQNSALTPATFAIRQQSSFGSSSILKPQNYYNDTYFASRTGKALINYHFNGVGLAYNSTSISVASSHLVKNPRNRALLRGSDTSQDNFIYFLNPDDNTITAFQFAEEYKLAALTPIRFNQDVTLIDIVTVNNKVYLLKYYGLSQQYMIESFEEDVYVDSQEDFEMDTTGLVTGLDRFEGYTVQVIYNNQSYGQYEVVDGEITVNNISEVSGTVQVGLLYDVELRTMYPWAGAENAPFMKNLTTLYVDYYKSLDFYINGKLVAYQNFLEIQAGLPLVPKTDTAVFTTVSGWARFDRDSIVITQSSPFDLQILGIGYQIDMAVI
jgi:hypothetical protein